MIHKMRFKDGKLHLLMNNQMHSNQYASGNNFTNMHLTLIYCAVLFCDFIWIRQLNSSHSPEIVAVIILLLICNKIR